MTQTTAALRLTLLVVTLLDVAEMVTFVVVVTVNVVIVELADFWPAATYDAGWHAGNGWVRAMQCDRQPQSWRPAEDHGRFRRDTPGLPIEWELSAGEQNANQAQSPEMRQATRRKRK